MSQPPPYVPVTPFISFEAQQSWFPGHELDVEFDDVSTSVNSIERNLSFIQKDDGTLANALVGWNQLSPAFQQALRAQGFTGAPPAGPHAIVTPETFGALGDGITDDTAAIQAAINFASLGFGGTVLMAGAYVISSTLVINAAVTLEGTGWGKADLGLGSYIQWSGAAGIPMINIADCYGAGVRDIRIIGNTTNQPSCAIQIIQNTSQQPGLLYGTVQYIWLSNIKIGSLFGGDQPSDGFTPQFQNGIIFAGVANGDTCHFSNISIGVVTNCGIDIQNPSASGIQMSTIWVGIAATGLRTTAALVVENLGLYNCTTTGIELASFSSASGAVWCNGLFSENCARMCIFTGVGGTLVVKGGFWGLSPSIAGDGIIINSLTAAASIDLEDFQLIGEFATPIVPIINAYNTAGGISQTFLRLVNTTGIYPGNINVGTMIFNNDSRSIIYQPRNNVSGTMPHPLQQLHLNYNLAADRVFQSWRNDFAGKFNVFGGPLNVRQLQSINQPGVVALLGSGATTWKYQIVCKTYDGKTSTSPSGSVTNAVSLAPGVATNKITWLQNLGAISYEIYGDGGLGGAFGLIGTVTWDQVAAAAISTSPTGFTFIDTGIAPGAAPPTVNTTGNVNVDGLTTTGSLTVQGAFAGPIPITKTTNYSQAAGDSSIIFNGAGSLTLTLLPASTVPGQWLIVKTIANQTVVSATSNVVPLVSNTAGTAILAGTAGKWAELQSDATNWIIMAGN